MAWWAPILAAIMAAGAAGAGGAGAAGAAGAGAAGAAGAGAAGGGGLLSALQGGASALGQGAAKLGKAAYSHTIAGPGDLAANPSKIAQPGVNQLTGGVTKTGLSTEKRLQRAAALAEMFLPMDAPPSPSPPQIPFDPRRFAPGVESRQTRGYR